jgi:integral membrane sensor domain MASE1
MAVSHDNIVNLRNAVPRSVRSIVLSPRFGTVLGFITFEIAYYFAFYGRSLSRDSHRCGSRIRFCYCALLKSRPERWWIFIVGILPIRLFAEPSPDGALWFLPATFAIDSAKGLATAFVLRRLMTNPLRFETVRDFGIFALFAVLLVPAASAFAGAAVREQLGDDYWAAWTRWFMGDALAHLVVTPAILYWVFGAPWKMEVFDLKRLGEAGLLVTALILACYWVSIGGGSTSDAESRFYTPVPFLIWAALRFGMAGISGAIALTAVVIVPALQV